VRGDAVEVEDDLAAGELVLLDAPLGPQGVKVLRRGLNPGGTPRSTKSFLRPSAVVFSTLTLAVRGSSAIRRVRSQATLNLTGSSPLVMKAQGTQALVTIL
jgi:hypothetical protein